MEKKQQVGLLETYVILGKTAFKEMKNDPETIKMLKKTMMVGFVAGVIQGTLTTVAKKLGE